ncbi:MAG: hypothetical protein LBU88_05470 [Treponema sp.]|jgi:hypothetical protein|nr:hypothetical protein [Treponema sp.]
MKRIILTVTLLLAGMAVFAQDLSYYTREYERGDGSFAERLAVLETLQEAGVQATGVFYNNALKFLLLRAPDIDSRREQEAAEKSVVILAQALGAAKHTAAAADLWHAAEVFDVVREPPKDPSEGLAMQAAIIALGDVDGKAYIPHIVQRLADYNTQTYRNAETRRRVQTAVIGCIRALETFKDASGYRPVFFAYTGSWDPMIKQIAGNALPNISEDPADVIIEIIRDPSVEPPIKLEAWREMLKTRAPNASKAKVASVALEIGWLVQTTSRPHQNNLREMRKSAIDIIRQFGASGETVYADLEKSYSNNFISNQPDFDEIAGVLNTLAALKTEEAVALLHKFLFELHSRRRSGPWRNKERQLFEWVVSSVGVTGTRSPEVRLLLSTIQRSDQYTSQERTMARNALNALGN